MRWRIALVAIVGVLSGMVNATSTLRGGMGASGQQVLGSAAARTGQGATASSQADSAESSGMRIMSRSQMLAERRAQALAPLDTITADNAAPILRETAGRLQRIYETDVADPKFGASMPEADIAEFKGTVTELWKGLAGVTDGDLQGASEEEGAQLIAFVRHLARLTDDLSNSGMPHQALMQEMETVYSEGEPILAAIQ